MPATSRQGESGSRRSASGLAGSPSKSTSFQPSDVRRVWPRCRSPCTRWASLRAAGDAGEHLLQGRPVVGERGYDALGCRQPLPHRRGSGCRVVGLRAELLAQESVHLADRDPEPVGLAGEVATDLVGVQVGLGEQVAGAGQRELPAVAGGAQELLQHGQLDRRVLGVGRRELHPAVELGDAAGAAAAECLVDLDVGVHSRRDPPEDLHQRVLAEGQRGVALLAAEQRGVGGEVQVVLAGAVEGEPGVGDVGARLAVGRDRLLEQLEPGWVASRSCRAS